MRVSRKGLVGPLIIVLGALGVSFVVSYPLRSQPSLSHARAFVAWGFVKRFATKGGEGPWKESQTIFARKGDGSWADIITAQSPSGQTGELRSFWDAASGKEVTLEPATKSAMTFFLSGSEMRTKIENSERCPLGVGSPTAQHERILGYDAVRVTEEWPAPPPNKMLIEAWVAPGLGCYALRRSEVWTDGPHNQFETTRVLEIQPPAWMFEVPPGYVERSPSQLSDAWAAKFGHPFLPESNLARMDGRYDAHRAPQP